MIKRIIIALAIIPVLPCLAEEIVVPRDSVPEDHMAWFGLRGPVQEVREYDYGDYGKTVWRFDKQGRLVEYIDYGVPFTTAGGCVFGLFDHYRYAYDENGKIQFLETYNADNNVVDAYADLTLELFPPQCKDADLFSKAEPEFGDTSSCLGVWKDDKKGQLYFGHRFDRYGNWIERVSAVLGDSLRAEVRVREIAYYKEVETIGQEVGVRHVTNQWDAEGRHWGNSYEFDREGNLTHFRSWVDEEELFVWERGEAVEEDGVPLMGYELISWDPNPNGKQEVTYWEAPVMSLEQLPEGCNEKTAFGLIFDYKGYAFEGLLYPLHDGKWIVLSYWCLDEMDGIYISEDENGEPIPAASQYKDPFKGVKYPVIQTDSVSCATRNYAQQTIKLYKNSKSNIVYDRLKVQCNVDVLDADPQTRRVLVRTNPNDWVWDEQPYVSVYGWMDEEWICANLMTTCP